MDDPTGGASSPAGPGEQSPTDGDLGAPRQDTQDTSANFTPPAEQPPTPPQSGAPFAPPTYPDMPGVPLSWAEPASPTTPYSGAPSTPAYPVYPGVPSVPLGSPIPGSYPTYPGYPASYPGYPGYPGAPSTPLSPYGAPLTIPLQQRDSPLKRALAEPFPAWLSAAIGAAALVLVVVAFLASVLAGNADWADGARTAGLVAFGIAFIGLIVAIVRGALGRRAASMVVLSAVLVVGLGAVGSASVFASPQIHGFQARALENGHDWQSAIHEYALGGEQAPNAPDIARALDEQGEQQLADGHYAAAITTFTTVTTQYAQSGDAVGRASADTFNAYSTWVKSNDADVPYADAISFIETYRVGASCSTSCASAAADVEVQALFQYGGALSTQGDYANAIAQFEKITAAFPTSAYASQAHSSAATAYLADGKQQVAAVCPTLDPFDTSTAEGPAYQTLTALYQTLTTKYADTPEGTQAKAALTAGQDISGTETGAPSRSSVVVFLSKRADIASQSFSSEYRSAVDSLGNFAFHKVMPGAYNFAGIVSMSSGAELIWYQDPTTNNIYSFHVYALCPLTGVPFDGRVS